jgi:hypothetical protein
MKAYSFNEELHNLYSSLKIVTLIKVKVNEMDETCSMNEELRKAYSSNRALISKSEGKPLGKPRHIEKIILNGP